jgi:hypothetical protein
VVWPLISAYAYGSPFRRLMTSLAYLTPSSAHYGWERRAHRLTPRSPLPKRNARAGTRLSRFRRDSRDSQQSVALIGLRVSILNRRQAVSITHPGNEWASLTLATSGHHSPWQRVGITHPGNEWASLTLATSGHHSPWQRVGITHPNRT